MLKKKKKRSKRSKSRRETCMGFFSDTIVKKKPQKSEHGLPVLEISARYPSR